MRAGLREANGEVLVERMEAPDVRQDHDAWGCLVHRPGAEGVEPVPVGRLKDQAFGVGDAGAPGESAAAAALRSVRST